MPVALARTPIAWRRKDVRRAQRKPAPARVRKPNLRKETTHA